MADKVDARIVKTTARMKDALLELMKTSPLDSISITELCNAARVNRNTFYSRYNEPVDLLKEIEADLLSRMWKTLGKVDTNDLDTFVKTILETIEENRDICFIIFSDHGNRHFVSSIVNMLKDTTVTLWEGKGMTHEEANATYHYCVGGALGVIEDWVKGGYKMSASDLGAMLSDLIESSRIRDIMRYQ